MSRSLMTVVRELRSPDHSRPESADFRLFGQLTLPGERLAEHLWIVLTHNIQRRGGFAVITASRGMHHTGVTQGR